MKFLKYIVFIILIVVIAGAVYFGAKDGKFDISASRSMQVPTAVLFEEVNNYQTWHEWGPWIDLDPEIQIQLKDSLVGVGAGYSWESDHPDVEEGSIVTTNTILNQSIEQDISFAHMFGSSTHQMYWSFTPDKSGLTTTVNWGIKGELSLLEKVMAAFSTNSKTPTKELYEAGLKKLEQTTKISLEQFTVSFDGISEYGGGYYMYVTAATTQAGLSAKMAPMMGKVATYMQTNKIAHSGMPFAIYNQVDAAAGTMIFSTAIPVKERIITTAETEVLCGYMPPLTAVKTTLKGNYNNLDKAYERALQYIQEKGLIVSEEHPMFEIYVNDPGNVPNPSNWETAVYIPIISPQETIN